MIKLFRNIRHQLISTGRTRKYLTYALGEIILVVIGILIALQINNWNEYRKAEAASRDYLAEIVNDLVKDTIRFGSGVENLENLIADEAWALDALSYSRDEVNRVWDCLSGWYMDYEITDRTFQRIQNEGVSKLVGYDDLGEKINTYYTVLMDRTESFTGWDLNEVTERQRYLRDLEETLEISNYRMNSLLAKAEGRYFPMRQDSFVNDSLVIAFANSPQGRNHFKQNYIRHVRIQDHFVMLIAEAERLIEDIERELAK